MGSWNSDNPHEWTIELPETKYVSQPPTLPEAFQNINVKKTVTKLTTIHPSFRAPELLPPLAILKDKYKNLEIIGKGTYGYNKYFNFFF